jgi:hypothetical protein
MKYFDRFLSFIHSIVDMEWRMEQSPHSRAARNRRAHLRKAAEKVHMVQQVGGETLTGFRVQPPRPIHQSLRLD